MKVEDLMVGDLVLHDGKVIRVDAVHKRKIGYHKTKDKLTWLFDGQFQSIQLTPEILEKNGFEKHISNTQMFFNHDEYRLSYYLVNKHFTIYNQIDGSLVQRVIVNVHELQHALKLCEIDKEIVV